MADIIENNYYFVIFGYLTNCSWSLMLLCSIYIASNVLYELFKTNLIHNYIILKFTQFSSVNEAHVSTVLFSIGYLQLQVALVKVGSVDECMSWGC